MNDLLWLKGISIEEQKAQKFINKNWNGNELEFCKKLKQTRELSRQEKSMVCDILIKHLGLGDAE